MVDWPVFWSLKLGFSLRFFVRDGTFSVHLECCVQQEKKEEERMEKNYFRKGDVRRKKDGKKITLEKEM